MANIQKITPNLWFDGNAKEAIDYYASVFPDSKILATLYYPSEEFLEDFQKPMAGKELTIDYELAGQRFTAINADSTFKFNEAVSFAINCKDQEELDYYWDKLSAVPEAEVCGWCKDKYGLSWQIVPEEFIEMLADPTRGPKAMQAMMKMKKLDVAKLREAFNS
jgi:predicted 3-demethylubiquinone-9 3-methyltransferase (glyoxalase superfamily)